MVRVRSGCFSIVQQGLDVRTKLSSITVLQPPGHFMAANQMCPFSPTKYTIESFIFSGTSSTSRKRKPGCRFRNQLRIVSHTHSQNRLIGFKITFISSVGDSQGAVQCGHVRYRVLKRGNHLFPGLGKVPYAKGLADIGQNLNSRLSENRATEKAFR